MLPARAHAAIFPQDPEAGCSDQASSSFRVMEYWLAPPSGTTVTAGTPVTFSARSATPLTIAVASSPELVSSPDIDSGTTSRVPFTEEPGPQTSFTYTYTSAVAANTPGTVYWQATASSAYVEPCAGFAPFFYRTDIRVLQILPAPVAVTREAHLSGSVEACAPNFAKCSPVAETVTLHMVQGVTTGSPVARQYAKHGHFTFVVAPGKYVPSARMAGRRCIAGETVVRAHVDVSDDIRCVRFWRK
jgi:hypothetical protein